MTTFAEEPTRTLTADGVLARAYLDGDENGFTVLYRRYYPDVVRLVRASVRDHALAEDLAQEAFSRALRYLRSYDPAQPFWPWIRKITRTVVASEMGRRCAEVPVDEVSRDTFVLPDSTDHIALQAAVRESLQLLPKRQSRALLLRYFEDRDPNDIAALFGLSRNALEQLLLRGRHNFVREYGARNAGAVTVFGLLVARVRRLAAGFGARVQQATGATMSMAGDVALSAAVAVGGIGVATIGQRIAELGDQAATTVAGSPTHGFAVGGDPGAALARSGGRWRGDSPTVTVPTDGTGVTYAQDAAAAGPAPRPRPSVGIDRPVAPAPAPGESPKPVDVPGPIRVSGAEPAAPPPAPAQPTPDAAVGAPGAQPDGGATPPPDVPDPEPEVWVTDEEAGASVTEDSSGTSGQMTVKQDPTQKGEVVTTGGKAGGEDSPAGGGLTVENTSDDGAVCVYLGLLCR